MYIETDDRECQEEMMFTDMFPINPHVDLACRKKAPHW